MTKRELIELRNKLVALLATGTIGLTAMTGCTAKTDSTDQSTSNIIGSETSVTTVLEPTSTTMEVTQDMATAEYMAKAKSIASAMYDANKEYFDEKQFTADDLEHVYYVLNDKYYDSEKNPIMTSPELERALLVIRELAMPQRVNEMLQKYNDMINGRISEKEYFDEVAASKFYDCNYSYSNFLDADANNTDVRTLAEDYSKVLQEVTERIKSGVDPEKPLLEFFQNVRNDQAGDINIYNSKNLLTETTTCPGEAFFTAAVLKGTADLLNTVIDGYWVTVETKNGTETVRVGLSGTREEENKLSDQEVVNEYIKGTILSEEDNARAIKLREELFQTHPFEKMCEAEVAIRENNGFYIIEKGKAKILG